MASVNVRKLHGGEPAKFLGHYSRWDGREDVEYENGNIRPELSWANTEKSFVGMDESETSKQTYERLKARVKELDRIRPPKRYRKDRVTMIALEIPAPEGLPPEKEEKFFSIAYQELARWCGSAENVSKLYIHRDEKHDYVDPVTGRIQQSRVHAHAIGIPWTQLYGVNAKNACTKERFRELQQAIHGRCEKELGIQFMDGTGSKSRADMEQLKTASAKASIALERQAKEQARQAQKELEDAVKALERAKAEKSALQEERSRMEQSISDCDRRAQAAYDRMIAVLRDEQYLQEHSTMVELLKEYYPDTWKNLEADFFDRAVDTDTVGQEPSDSLRELDRRAAAARNDGRAPEMDDIYAGKAAKDGRNSER